MSHFTMTHPFCPLVIGALSRAPESLDVEIAFTNRQLAAGGSCSRRPSVTASFPTILSISPSR